MPAILSVTVPFLALVLAAVLPSASSVSLLAERFGADNGRIAPIIVTSTALAFVIFTLMAWAVPQVTNVNAAA